MPSMTIQTLTRQYRKMAKTHHPDKGGKHEKFIKLNHAYSDLLRTIKSRSGKKTYSTHHRF
jgi:DnaJ-class molecular chaperone